MDGFKPPQKTKGRGKARVARKDPNLRIGLESSGYFPIEGPVRPRHGLTIKSRPSLPQGLGLGGLDFTMRGLGSGGDQALSAHPVSRGTNTLKAQIIRQATTIRHGSASSSGSSIKPKNLPPIARSPSLKSSTNSSGIIGNQAKPPVPSITTKEFDKSSTTKTSKDQVKQKPPKSKVNALPGISKKVDNLSDFSDLDRIVDGWLEGIPEERTSIVRVFLSSTFSDYRLERNSLFKNAYPQLKEYCSDLGLEFQVVDLRWGIPDEAINDHSVEELCLKEIENSSKLSQGPHFVTMLGDRYGYQPLNTTISSADFITLSEFISEEDTALLHEWYKKDLNNIPPEFVLQPISSNIIHYEDGTKEERLEAKQEWSAVLSKMQSIIKDAAVAAVKQSKFTEDKAREFYNSVTEKEVKHGILKASDKHRAVAFVRHINDLDVASSQSKRYTDIIVDDGETRINEAVKALRNESVQYVKSHLQSENLHTYQLSWNSNGVCEDKHADYAKTFCDDFVTNLKRLIEEYQNRQNEQLIKQSNYQRDKMVVSNYQSGKTRSNHVLSEAAFLVSKHVVDDLQNELKEIGDWDSNEINHNKSNNFEEILHHLLYAKHLLCDFGGRTDEIDRIKNCLFGENDKYLCIVHGETGHGKSSIMAEMAKQSRDYVQQCVVVLRFVGKTPVSSKPFSLVKSIITQICLAYGFHEDKSQLKNYNKAKWYLQYLLNVVSALGMKQRPLILIIDGIDGLQNSNGSVDMSWIPQQLNRNVRIILSLNPNHIAYIQATLPIAHYKVEIGNFSEEDITSFMENQLHKNKRCLTSAQMQVIHPILTECPSPLFASLLAKEALSWKSYHSVDELQIAKSASAIIDRLLKKLEKRYGDNFCRAMCGYISTARYGITELELENVLSLDDDVLVSVYQYHDPPVYGVVTMPPVMIARLKFDLKNYLGQRQVYGKTVIYWQFDTFQETCVRKYVNESKAAFHLQLALLLSIERPFKRTINLEKRNLVVEYADRNIQLQLLSPHNTRRLHCVPYHLYEAGAIDKLQSEALYNPQFIACFVEGNSMPELFELYMLYLSNHRDLEKCPLRNALRNEFAQISRHPCTLEQQILPYIQTTEDELVRSMAQSILSSSHKPLLLSLLPYNEYYNSALRMTKTQTNKLLSTSKRNKMVIATTQNKIKLVDQVSGNAKVISASFSNKIIAAQFSGNATKLAVLTNTDVQVYNCQDGKLLKSFKNTAKSQQKLSSCICVNDSGCAIFLAGPDRLGYFEEADLQYTPKAAMNLSGCTQTTNLKLFAKNISMSTHSLKKDACMVAWNVDEQKLVHKLVIPCDVADGFLYKSGDGSFVIAGCTDGQILQIDMENSRIHSTIQERPPSFYSGRFPHAFEEQRNQLIAYGNSHVMNIWQISKTSAAKIHSFDTLSNVITANFNGDTAAMVSDNGQLGVYDVASETFRIVLEDDEPFNDIVLTGNDMLFTLSKKNVLKQWDVEMLLKQTEEINTTGTSPKVNSVANIVSTTLVPSSSELFTYDGSEISVWRLSTGDFIRSLEVHAKDISRIDVAQTMDDNRVLYVLTSDNTMTISNCDTGEEIQTILNVYQFKIVSSNLHVIMQNKEDNKLVYIVSDIESKNQDSATDLVERFDCKDSSVLADFIQVHGDNAMVNLTWTTSKGTTVKQLISIQLKPNKTHSMSLPKNGLDFQFAPLSDTSVLILSSEPALIWNTNGSSGVSNDEILRKCDAYRGCIACLHSSHDKKTIALGTNGGIIVVLKHPLSNVQGEASFDEIQAHKDQISALHFIKNASFLLSASTDKTIKVWDMLTSTCFHTVYPHLLVTHLSAVLDDQTLIVNASDEQSRKRVMLFNICF